MKSEANKRKNKRFDVFRFFFDVSTILALEIFKNAHGQNGLTTLIDLSICISLAFLFNETSLHWFAYFCITSMEITEALTWYLNQTPFNYQVIYALDIVWIIEVHPEMLIYLIALLAILILFSRFPFKKRIIILPIFDFFIYSMILAAFSFLFIRNFIANLQNFQTNEVEYEKYVNPRVNTFLQTPLAVNKTGMRRRNLILVMMESIITESIKPNVTPFLYNLSKQIMYVDSFEPSLYAGWTSSSLLLTQCNVPQIVTNPKPVKRDADSIKVYTELPCVPDFLHMLGYKLHIYFVNELHNLMGIEEFLLGHHWKKNNPTVNGANQLGYDKDLFDFFVEKQLPIYNEMGDKELYAALIMNENTHAPFYLCKKCKPKISRNFPLIRRNNNCFDQEFEKFYKKFTELNMSRHTDIIMYGDHVPPGNKVLPKPHKLFMMFSSLPHENKITKPVTYYDFAPTVLDFMNITEYSPRFPFGNSIFKPEPGAVPSKQDLNYMYNTFADAYNMTKKMFLCNGIPQRTICTKYT